MKKILFGTMLSLLTLGAFLYSQGAAVTETTYTALVGQKVVLNVTAEGTTPITYNWYKDGTFIGVTDTITLTSVQTTNAGVYKVTAVNMAGQADSDLARLIVVTPVAPNKVKITVTITNN